VGQHRWTQRYELSPPWHNGFGESFDGRLRDELLNAEICEHLLDAKSLAPHWRHEYSHRRPHSSLGYAPSSALRISACRRSARGFAPLLHVGKSRNPICLGSQPLLVTLDRKLGAGQKGMLWCRDRAKAIHFYTLYPERMTRRVATSVVFGRVSSNCSST